MQNSVVLNSDSATIIRAMGESLALCEAAGLNRETVVEALAGTAQRVCGLKKDKIIHRDWSTDLRSNSCSKT